MPTPADLESAVRESVKRLYGPGFEGAEFIQASLEPSSSYIREKLRERGASNVDADIIASAPKEHRFVFRITRTLEGISTPITRSIVVLADESGSVLDVIESK